MINLNKKSESLTRSIIFAVQLLSPLLPFEQFTVYSRLSSESVQRKIDELVERGNQKSGQWGYLLMVSGFGSHLWYGRRATNHFYIVGDPSGQTSRMWRSDNLPQISGTICQDDNSGSRMDILMHPQYLSMIMSVVFITLFGLIFQSILPSLFVYILVWISFKQHSGRIKRFLQRYLES